MRKHVGLLLLLGIILAVPTAMIAQDTRPADADAQAVRKAAQAYAEAFNRGDADGVMALWGPNPDYVDDAGEDYQGRDTIAQLVSSNVALEDRNKLAIETDDVRMIKPDVAIEDGT